MLQSFPLRAKIIFGMFLYASIVTMKALISQTKETKRINILGQQKKEKQSLESINQTFEGNNILLDPPSSSIGDSWENKTTPPSNELEGHRYRLTPIPNAERLSSTLNKTVTSSSSLNEEVVSSEVSNDTSSGKLEVTVSGNYSKMALLENIDPLSTNNESTGQGRPPLSDLVGDDPYNISGNVQFLLDFAIVGHAKTGTSKIMTWLAGHQDIEMYYVEKRKRFMELHDLTHGRPAEFVRKMYALPTGPIIKHGYKAPNDISYSTPRNLLRTYFPETKLIIGVREPVRWFESWYNFKARQGKKMPSIEQFTASRAMRLDHGKFHVHLAAMRKTNVTDPDQWKLLKPYINPNSDISLPPLPMPNKVFLYEVSQPFDKDEGRNLAFRKDLSNFLELSVPLDRLVTRSQSSNNFHYALDICDMKYDRLRATLTRLGRDASDWIRNYFLDLDDVTVSSRDHLEEILKTWGKDPCTFGPRWKPEQFLSAKV